MAIYTYVVDHGEDSPAIGADTEVNGGKIQSVMFDDALEKLSLIEELLEAIHCETDCDETRELIEEFNKSGGASL